MGRLIFLLAIAVVIYALIKTFQRRSASQDNQKKVEPPIEDMVRCAQCGVNLPRSESILSDKKLFCCVEHRDDFR